jgi:membrane protein YqaA with SNARE-associated domain
MTNKKSIPEAAPDIRDGGPIRRLYDWTLRMAAKKRAGHVLGAVSFAESSFFPIPPDFLLIPMILAKPAKAFRYAGICLVTSVLGGLFGYAIGMFLFDLIGRPVMEFYGYLHKFEDFQALYNNYGGWIVGLGGLTPFPYKVITIASGITGLNLITFIIISIFARGVRFYLLAGILYWIGPPAKAFVEKYFGLMTILGFVLLGLGFVAAYYLF